MVKKRIRVRTSKTGGLPPGTLMHVGERRVDEVEISVIDFDESTYRERRGVTVDDCVPFLSSRTVTWIDVVGLHDTSLLKQIREKFEIHPLVMEDILNTEQRPKVQDLGDYLFLVVKMIRPAAAFETEQVSLILKDQCVITFQEQRGDVFDFIRERIRGGKGKVRKSGADYLLYALIDSIIDGYFPYLEGLSESLEETEEQILDSRDIITIQDLYGRRRELIGIRKGLMPMREILSILDREDTMLIGRFTNIYLKDAYDHVIQLIDTMEGLRDVVTGLLELHMSISSHRMNEVMKVLTVIATIFIPLTFVVGIYGMNFAYMPELTIRGAYPAVLLTMVSIAAGMVFYFKRKKWF